MAPNICPVHDCEMEWVEIEYPMSQLYDDGGYWFCEECNAEKEAEFNDPVDDNFTDWDYDR